jgi:hypothetical protein
MSEISLQQKKDRRKREREEQGWKKGETSVEKLHVLRKKREDEIYKLLGEIISKERKEITISYSAKSNVWPHPYPHIICICTTFYSLTSPFLTTIHYTILHQP